MKFRWDANNQNVRALFLRSSLQHSAVVLEHITALPFVTLISVILAQIVHPFLRTDKFFLAQRASQSITLS